MDSKDLFKPKTVVQRTSKVQLPPVVKPKAKPGKTIIQRLQRLKQGS